ncbi:hypothetical protein [Deinococcus radiotolerans]|uniref:Lipoprotein n=1 Tax=Deinococcus radiotolerans TaxID=1309407 RepID=A0ABQ2FM26_9DEIO|nr:hypothetical protein [Deinococcus radiotolerans]GGL01825.1 hypothetical protein GCM10010844_20420 [Deinococcus radiotolerans]
MKHALPLIALAMLTACHRFAPAPFGGLGTFTTVTQEALDQCRTLSWTMRILDATTKEDVSASLRYRLIQGDVIREDNRAFGPVIISTASPLFQLVISQLPPNDGIIVNAFTCERTGERVETPAQPRQLGGNRATVTYTSTGGLQVR